MPYPYEEFSRLHGPVQPWDTGYLHRDGHDIYYEQCGIEDGIPVLFLHGGPGAGCSPAHRRLFDPRKYRAILFDQRGCGRSKPYASLDHNTTTDLVEDIEALRRHLGLQSMVIFGGSWGSTLALCYGIAYPERCDGFVLRGIFLGTRPEIDWFLYDMGRFFPEAHREFTHFLPQEERSDLLTAYLRRLTGLSSGQALAAAERWASYENSCATLSYERRSGGKGALAISLIEAHYFAHNCFMEPDHILSRVKDLRHRKAVIVNGRHDVICPPFSAVKLADKWGPNARLHLVDDAGHSAFEPSILSHLLKGLDHICDNLRY
ncbi:MAG: prolyl aminopeptidase [Candidatus Puniceispirillaceae bacterium]